LTDEGRVPPDPSDVDEPVDAHQPVGGPPQGWSGVDAFDAAVAEWLDRIRTPALDRFCYGLSSAADHSLLWFAVGGFRAARRASPRIALRFGGALAFESVLTNGFIKSAFGRVRPPGHHDDPPEGPLPYGMRRPITSSFPSGHATAAFTAVTLLAADSPRSARPFWYALATLVAASRVYVRMHHASDVIVGAALGLALGRVIHRVLPLE